MNMMIAAVTADPYSNHKTQFGTCQGPPNACECQKAFLALIDFRNQDEEEKSKRLRYEA
jgi:hypothetical protein